jgi:Nif-specific regulatory protein
MSRLSLLVDLAALLPRQIDLDHLLGRAAERIAEALGAERATIWLVDERAGGLVTRVATLPEVERLVQPLGQGISGHVARTGTALAIDDVAVDPRFDPSADRATGYTTRSMLAAPIRGAPGEPVRGVLQVLNSRRGSFGEEDLTYLQVLGNQLASVLDLTTLRASEGSAGITVRGRYNRVVGRSATLARVYERVSLAAETDATVLLRGETGTGKGVFAKAIHDNSPRQNGPFVVVDATTLPPALVESVLFGHERGAFTGADRRVAGKLELAAGGTLFLDEIGELPRDLQGKLLRVLQDRQFERIGGSQTLHADVRVLCATHRDLEAMVAEGTFREDLYYRLRVVEIELPPLRARGSEEIELLAGHFAQSHATRYGRPVPRFSPELLRRLVEHPWPGNVRELEHWVESAVVLHKDGVVPLEAAPKLGIRRASDAGAVTVPLGLSLEDASRHYARAVLERTGDNKTEAARLLGIGRNTLARLLRGPS